MEVWSVRERPEKVGEFISYFQEKWADAYSGAMYRDCLTHTPGAPGPLPQWYLLREGGRTLGCAGLIPNDFISRADLWPWLCALYVEKEFRCQGIAGRLLDTAVKELKSKGITPVYLITDHTSFYERYGWEFLCMVQGDGDPDMIRMYIHR